MCDTGKDGFHQLHSYLIFITPLPFSPLSLLLLSIPSSLSPLLTSSLPFPTSLHYPLSPLLPLPLPPLPPTSPLPSLPSSPPTSLLPSSTSVLLHLQILSLGMEGKVLLWQLNKRERSLHILRGFHVMSVAAAPPLSPRRGVGHKMARSTAVGGRYSVLCKCIHTKVLPRCCAVAGCVRPTILDCDQYCGGLRVFVYCKHFQSSV